MALIQSEPVAMDIEPEDFLLRSTDGSMVSLETVAGERGVLVAFICNHCPYVIAKAERLANEIRALSRLGIGAVAIMSNDALQYPEDSFDNMVKFKKKYSLPCHYVIDTTQAVAKTYGAVCTPDLFLYIKDFKDGKLKLKYRGRLDSGGSHNNDEDVPELHNAAEELVHTGQVEAKQYPSMGCSIKWK